MDRILGHLAQAASGAGATPAADQAENQPRAAFARQLSDWAPAGEGDRAEAARRMLVCWDGWGESLNLSGLALDGLPDCLGELYQLRELDLSGNRLTDLPGTLSELYLLDNLDLSRNRLQIVPETLFELPDNSEVRVGGNQIPLLEMRQFQAIVDARGRGPDLYDELGGINAEVWEELDLGQQAALSVAFDQWRADLGDNRLAQRDWHDSAHEHARAFGGWMCRLRQTPEFEHSAQHAVVVARVAALIDAMNEDAALRERCFHIAHESAGTCDDNVLLGLNRFDMALHNRRAERGELTESQLLAHGRSMFRLHEIEKIAHEKVSALAGAPHAPDPVEVHLAYQVGLRECLALPLVVSAMRFDGVAAVRQSDLGAARQRVEHAEGGMTQVLLRRFDRAMTIFSTPPTAGYFFLPKWQPLAAYLAEHYQPWQQHVARAYADELEQHSQIMYAFLEQVEHAHEQGGLTEGDYVSRLNSAKRYATAGVAYRKALACMAG